MQRGALTESELDALAREMSTQFGWDTAPRPFQILGTQAQLEGNDLIIQAPTGSGKTAVVAGPHMSPRAQGRLTIMVVPLLALQHEMVSSSA